MAVPLRCFRFSSQALRNFDRCTGQLAPLGRQWRAFHITPPPREEHKSFKPQLYESVAQRVARDRERQRKYVADRAALEENRLRPFAITFSALFLGAACFVLGQYYAIVPAPSPTLPLKDTKPPQHDNEETQLQACWVDLVRAIGKANVSTDVDDLIAHAGSEWSSYTAKDSEHPFMIAYPATTEEVSKIMKVCADRKAPVTAYSGGTSLEGHFASTRGGVVIDLSRMDKILQVHKADLDAVVQPAVGWQELNEELAQDNLFFPPDPGPGAMIGGMVGTGCSGTNAYHYGTMREWVISLTVVLADGTIIKTRQRPRKSSAGYDLTRLFIGSEGTLGIVTEATLKLTTKPKNSSVAIASFPTVRDAAQCVAKVVEDGVPVAAVEILDDVQMRCINESGSTSRRWTEAPTLFFKFAGTPAGVKEQIAVVKAMARAARSKTFEFARSAGEMEELWSARKDALWSVMAKKQDGRDHVWTTDVAVPISRLPDIIEQTKEDLDSCGLLGSIVGHVGDGNFHSIILFNDRQRKIAEGVVHRMVKRAVEMEGTVTGEHGVGLVKRDYLDHELGESTVDMMRRLKQTFDPLCILNCDKVVRVQKPKAGEVAEW